MEQPSKGCRAARRVGPDLRGRMDRHKSRMGIPAPIAALVGQSQMGRGKKAVAVGHSAVEEQMKA
jgi:hypothetical protein